MIVEDGRHYAQAVEEFLGPAWYGISGRSNTDWYSGFGFYGKSQSKKITVVMRRDALP
jgi:hypothetical protein